MCVLSCLAECFFQLVEFLTKFATVRAAITGQAFLAAGRDAADLFKRNFLKAYAVWWIPPLVLQTAAFLVSAAWGCLVFGIAWLAWHNAHPHNGFAVRARARVAGPLPPPLLPLVCTAPCTPVLLQSRSLSRSGW